MKVGGAVILVPVRPVLVPVHAPVPAAVLVQSTVQVLGLNPVLEVGGGSSRISSSKSSSSSGSKSSSSSASSSTNTDR